MDNPLNVSKGVASSARRVSPKPQQQQPSRSSDRQQQQSSGSGEFQPRPKTQPGEQDMPDRWPTSRQL
jgi:hypothetical protein